MKKYGAIAAFGVVGAWLRYGIRSGPLIHWQGLLPVNTLFINVMGSLLLAFLLTITLRAVKIDAALRLGLTTGFCGAFTTFSTFCKEVVTLGEGQHWMTALVYLVLSLALGLLGTYMGVVLARLLERQMIHTLERKQGVRE